MNKKQKKNTMLQPITDNTNAFFSDKNLNVQKPVAQKTLTSDGRPQQAPLISRSNSSLQISNQSRFQPIHIPTALYTTNQWATPVKHAKSTSIATSATSDLTLVDLDLSGKTPRK